MLSKKEKRQTKLSLFRLEKEKQKNKMLFVVNDSLKLVFVIWKFKFKKGDE